MCWLWVGGWLDVWLRRLGRPFLSRSLLRRFLVLVIALSKFVSFLGLCWF